ncbi:bacterial transferase hexapeptide family protein [Synechococcus sp. BIOS-E4-1]|uniref:acetyltransferase n=1 Tax=Synechococcus sp. BIOS-E4-1 TaxID=1400864 RepID=UPI0016487D43|nr:acetyltransferase [Synechococcus sp. BIOS-E4-1]QNI52872.1 bacterial transferase hexapeptide family protein [Synechococcus sp. BIOS-E4-1]
MKKNLVMIGSGLFAEVACAYFEEFTGYKVVAFSSHKNYITSGEIYGRPWLAIEDLTREFSTEDADVFVAIGYGQMNKIRQRVYFEMKDKGYACASFVYPGVKIWDSTTFGENVFIFEDNTIQPFTQIGSNTIFWSGNHIGHHSRIGNHCFISSHVVISGSCAVGDNVFIGVNSTLHDSIVIGDECLIGAGATISKNTSPKSVYVAQQTKVFPKTSDQLRF